jgi:hypothetical protein
MTGVGSALATERELERRSVVPLEDVFVSIDFDGNVAYVAYEDESAIRWREVLRVEGELLVRMGARAHLHLGSTSRSNERATHDQRLFA